MISSLLCCSGLPFDQAKYSQTLYECALLPDLKVRQSVAERNLPNCSILSSASSDVCHVRSRLLALITTLFFVLSTDCSCVAMALFYPSRCACNSSLNHTQHTHPYLSFSLTPSLPSLPSLPPMPSGASRRGHDGDRGERHQSIRRAKGTSRSSTHCVCRCRYLSSRRSACR